jgi:ATP-dependent DNA ligase
MTGYVNGIDWVNCEAMKYWSFPKTYKKDSKAETKNLIFGGRYWGALKRDGYYQRFVKDEDGQVFMIARSKNVKGEAVNKIEWMPHLYPLFEAMPNGTVLLGEVYLPGKEGSKNVTSILGCLKDKAIARQMTDTKLHFYIFDVMCYAGTDFYTEGFLKRKIALEQIAADYNNYNYVEWAEYYNGAELWNKISEYLAAGNEGAVITREDCPVYFKRTPARMTIKIKKEVLNTIDCFFTGRWTPPTREYTGKEIETWQLWYNTKTGEKLPRGCYFREYSEGQMIIPVTKGFYNDWAGSLEIGVLNTEGKIQSIGLLSNLTEDIKADPESVKGKVIEVTCMEIDEETKGLRHAKLVQFRPDLGVVDCTAEKVFG